MKVSMLGVCSPCWWFLATVAPGAPSPLSPGVPVPPAPAVGRLGAARGPLPHAGASSEVPQSENTHTLFVAVLVRS